MIRLLNRRFVSCYYNAFPGTGFDEAADAVRARHESRVKYGAIVTPDGDFVGAFGTDMGEMRRVLERALADKPEYARMTAVEQVVFDTARARPADVPAQLAAAQLLADLWRFDEAREVLRAAVARVSDTAGRARLAYACAHLALERAALESRTDDEAVASLRAIEGLAEDLEDDRAMDLFRLRVERVPAPGFYTGMRLRPSEDAAAAAKELEAWIERAPRSNRIGEMHFYLGLAYHALGLPKKANDTWEHHAETYPEDRFAMLSRIHHEEYVFSPYKVRGRSRVVDPRGSSGGGAAGAAGSKSFRIQSRILARGCGAGRSSRGLPRRHAAEAPRGEGNALQGRHEAPHRRPRRRRHSERLRRDDPGHHRAAEPRGRPGALLGARFPGPARRGAAACPPLHAARVARRSPAACRLPPGWPSGCSTAGAATLDLLEWPRCRRPPE